jgi:hypothetical protein
MEEVMKPFGEAHTVAGRLSSDTSGLRVVPEFIPGGLQRPLFESALNSSETRAVNEELRDFNIDLESYSQTESPELFFGGERVLPAANIRNRTREDGKSFHLSIDISGQHPMVTAEKAAQVVKERFLDAKDFLAAILEKAQVRLETKREKRSTNEAIVFNCAAYIIKMSHDGEVLGDDLKAHIREASPTFLEDRVVQGVLELFSGDPREFIRKFRKHADSGKGSSNAGIEFMSKHGLEVEETK